jgi:hypothetical protein
MREHHKREWLNVQKQPWSAPRMQEIPITQKVLEAFKTRYPACPSVERLSAADLTKL